MRAVPTSSALSKAQPFIVPLGVPLKSVLAAASAPPSPPPLHAASASARTGRTAAAQRCVFLMRTSLRLRPGVAAGGSASDLSRRALDASSPRSGPSSLAARGRDALDEVPLPEGEEDQHRERDEQ